MSHQTFIKLPASKTRKKVICICKVCKGKSELCDLRTRDTHIERYGICEEFVSSVEPQPDIPSLTNPQIESSSISIGIPTPSLMDVSLQEELFLVVTKDKRKKKAIIREQPYIDLVEENLATSDYDEEVIEIESESDDEDIMLDYSTPDIESSEEEIFENIGNHDERFSWILIWILKYQQRYRLPDTATDSLLKFIHYLLTYLDQDQFTNFPKSLYLVRKLMGLGLCINNYATCLACNKLYNHNEVITKKPGQIPICLRCTFVEYSNHPMFKMRQLCNQPLAKEVPTKDGILYRPLLSYPIINIKNQLQLLYSQRGFEASCRKWVNRKINNNYLADIYEGNIWKTFKDQDTNFFTAEHADTHLGLMINLDWFSPFQNSIYSTGAIYAVICNLPRELRFKPQNIITLALLPGPKEVKLHHINHYLAPLVDQLLELWNGIEITTNESPMDTKKIKCAVICYSCDIPAARKLCGQISARIACFQCEKHAQFDARHQPNFGGFVDMNNWFVECDVDEIKINAHAWLQCKTEDQRKKHLSKHFVRWSELYHLLYFNPVRHVTVDPMHCLFLRIAK